MELIDKKGAAIILDSDPVLYNGEHYYRIYKRDNGELEMLSCTNGYLHDVTQEDLKDFEIMCPYKGNEHLLECD